MSGTGGPCGTTSADADYVTWLLEDWTLLGAQFASICLALLIVMGLARRLGDNWWLPGAAVFVGIAALFTFISPYIDYTTEPLRDEDLIEAADRFESELGLPDVPAYVQEVSQDTEQANAYAYGFGPTRRIVFWDTVLTIPSTPGSSRPFSPTSWRTTRSSTFRRGSAGSRSSPFPAPSYSCWPRRGAEGWAHRRRYRSR